MTDSSCSRLDWRAAAEQYYMLPHEFDGNVSDKSRIKSNGIVEMSKKRKSFDGMIRYADRIMDQTEQSGKDQLACNQYPNTGERGKGK
jgi:hypothetical protein